MIAFPLLLFYGLGLFAAAGIHAMAASGDKRPPMKIRWLWTFLTIFWPIGILYHVCKYLFWE